jgi:hypothetical protein
MPNIEPITCARDCDYYEYCNDGDPESSQEGSGDADLY